MSQERSCLADMVSLETFKEVNVSESHTHRHVENDDFVILSSVPPEALIDCKVLSTALPGRFGTFILPQDAIVMLKGHARTHIKDVHAMLHAETTVRASSVHQRRLNHVTIEACEHAVEQEEEEVESDTENEEEGEEPFAVEDEVSEEEDDEDAPFEWKDS